MSKHVERFKVTAVFEYDLPFDEDERQDLYGTIVPAECIQLDYDNDSAAFVVEHAGDFTLTNFVAIGCGES